MGKSDQRIGKTHNCCCLQKSYLTSRTGIGGHKKKESVTVKAQQ